MFRIILDKQGRFTNGVVKVHESAFPDFFLTSLGSGFLNIYYKCFAKHKDGFLYVALDESKNVIGFGAATKQCRGFNTNLIISNPLAFGWRFLVLLFSNPKSLLRLVKNFTKKSDEVEDNEDYGELYSIGTKKECAGKGVGSQLLAELEKGVRAAGCEKLSLTTDYYGNDATIHFYKKNGYEVLYEFTAYPDRKMFRFIKYLDD